MGDQLGSCCNNIEPCLCEEAIPTDTERWWRRISQLLTESPDCLQYQLQDYFFCFGSNLIFVTPISAVLLLSYRREIGVYGSLKSGHVPALWKEGVRGQMAGENDAQVRYADQSNSRERERAVYKTISLEIKTHWVLWELMKPPVTKP